MKSCDKFLSRELGRATIAGEPGPAEDLHLDRTLELVLTTPSKVKTWIFSTDLSVKPADTCTDIALVRRCGDGAASNRHNSPNGQFD
jgi:hypothetical protein